MNFRSFFSLLFGCILILFLESIGGVNISGEGSSQAENILNESDDLSFVTIAILAKDKAHVLPLYLSCIENQSWPKEQTYLYIRTNNNNDNTAEILREWIEKVGHLYAGIAFDDRDVSEQVQNYKPHEWNTLRFQVLGKIRQDSVEWAKNRDSHYLVVDCDNFIYPHTLETLVETGLPIVAPLLRKNEQSYYSNYHAAVDQQGYFMDSPFYLPILFGQIRGLIQLPVVHCTYFIRSDVLDEIVYDDGSGRYEYVIFSDHARKRKIPQYLDNRETYGYITFANTKEEFEKELWRYKFFDQHEKLKVAFTNIYKAGAWAVNSEGKGSSGHGSTASNTIQYRSFLENFLEDYAIQTVVDVGCGDWEFSRLINWEGIDYQGYDIVEHVIEANKQLYSTETIRFYNENFLDADLPCADLIIIKDVFQHLSNNDIVSFLPQLKKYKYCLIINDTVMGGESDNNQTVDVVGYRRLDLTQPPFNVEGKRILLFRCGMVTKEVFFVEK